MAAAVALVVTLVLQLVRISRLEVKEGAPCDWYTSSGLTHPAHEVH